MNEASTARRRNEIFEQALARTGRARLEFLAERCGGDAELRHAVTGLLEAAESPDERLDDYFAAARARLWRSMVSSDAVEEEDLSGQRIDGWRIDGKIARGGLATVYRARRENDESRPAAALKVLRRGLDTDDIVARFRSERNILSSLDHPSIARLLDGGALPDGRPFLVLEFVDGQAITAHCEERDLDLPARLRLLIDVLRALHHAHARRVVHRDLKPSNVLVSGSGRVVLLDFGIAKLLDGGGEPGSCARTRAGVALLTPGYGSPEQSAGRAVTPASDVYQAGLMLYELLTGKRPFSGEPADAGFEVPAPSSALHGSPRFELVRGDLDAIVRKATRRDAAQRYASADEMARDLQRHVAGRPVLARPAASTVEPAGRPSRNPRRTRMIAAALVGIVAYAVHEVT